MSNEITEVFTMSEPQNQFSFSETGASSTTISMELYIAGTVANVSQLPASAEQSTLYNVGASAPYDIYMYDNGSWINLGQLQGASGENGRGVPSGGTAGQVLTKASGTDYDTVWATMNGGMTFTVTLAANSWSSNMQTVSNTNFLAVGFAYIVTPTSSNYVKYSQAQIYAEDVTTTGEMVFHCVNVPDSDLTVNVARVVMT